MSDKQRAPGWAVLDPDGNVVDSGPGVDAELADPDVTEEETDNGGAR